MVSNRKLASKTPSSPSTKPRPPKRGKSKPAAAPHRSAYSLRSNKSAPPAATTPSPPTQAPGPVLLSPLQLTPRHPPPPTAASQDQAEASPAVFLSQVPLETLPPTDRVQASPIPYIAPSGTRSRTASPLITFPPPSIPHRTLAPETRPRVSLPLQADVFMSNAAFEPQTTTKKRGASQEPNHGHGKTQQREWMQDFTQITPKANEPREWLENTLKSLKTIPNFSMAPLTGDPRTREMDMMSEIISLDFEVAQSRHTIGRMRAAARTMAMIGTKADSNRYKRPEEVDAEMAYEAEVLMDEEQGNVVIDVEAKGEVIDIEAKGEVIDIEAMDGISEVVDTEAMETDVGVVEVDNDDYFNVRYK